MTDHLTARLDENDRITEAATPEGDDWEPYIDDEIIRLPRKMKTGERIGHIVGIITDDGVYGSMRGADAAFIAHARSELPALNRALRAVLERLEDFSSLDFGYMDDGVFVLADDVDDIVKNIKQDLNDAMGEE